MECIENPVESVEKFEHERELLNKMESLSNMIDLEGIAESNAKDVVSVVSSTEPGTKKELNGNLSPEFMSMPISKVSNYELEPYSGHALLEPDLNINSGDMEYSDISSCSDTEPNLDGKSSSPIEPAICANEETQPFEGVDQNVRNSVDFLLEISPSTLKEISEPCPKQDAEPQVTADETTVDVNHMNGDCNDEPPLTNADTPCGELQRVDDLKCAEDELVKDIISSDFVHSDELGSAQSCSTSGLDCTNDISSTLSSEIKTVDCLSVYQLENTSDIETSTTTQGTSEICNMDENVPCTIQVESTDLEIESRDKAENPEHGNGSPGICQLEINQQVLGDTLFNTDPGNPTDERKCLTSEEHVERGSFGFLETCFGLNNKSQNAEEHLQEVSGSTLDSQPDPPVLQKIVLDSHIQNCGLNDLLHDPPVLSAMLMSRAFDSGLKNYSYASFKSSKRKLQPVVLIKTTEQKTCDGDKYQCSTCGESAPSVDELIEHNHRRHSVHTHQLCPTCDCYFTGDSFNGHPCGKTHTLPTYAKELPVEKAIFVCRYCTKSFVRKSFHEQHILNHIFVTDHRCKRCGIYFPDVKKWLSHKNKKCFPLVIAPPIRFANPNEPTPKNLAGAHKVEKNVSDLELRACYVKLMDVYQTSDCPEKIQCPVCCMNFKFRAQMYGHLNSHSFQKPLECKKCGRSFKYSWNLNKHVKEQCSQKDSPHEESPLVHTLPKFKCPLCVRTFKQFCIRTRHLREQCLKDYTRQGRGKINGKHQCPLCKVQFTMACNRNRHIKRTCPKLKFYTIRKVSKKTKALGVILKKKTDDKASVLIAPAQRPLNFKCSLCPKMFRHSSNLSRHRAKHRSDSKAVTKSAIASGAPLTDSGTAARKPESKALAENTLYYPYSCRYCEKKFSCSKSFKKHLTRHKGNKPFRCFDCGKSFARHGHLISHKNVHKRNMLCTVCLKVFSNIGDLVIHRQSHPNKGMLKCPECPLEFRFPVLLRRHMGVHERKRKPNLPRKEAPQKVVKNEEEFKCLLCKKDFGNPKALSEHCLIHIPAFDVSKCPFCKTTCTNHNGLIRHIRIHTGEKPFCCKLCGQHFKRKDYVTFHEAKCKILRGSLQTTKSPQVKAEQNLDRSNKSSELFSCSYCPRVFNIYFHLKLHVKAHLAKTLFLCSKCGMYYRRKVYKKHVENCLGKTSSLPTKTMPFECMHCGQKFHDQDRYLQHEAYCTGLLKHSRSQRSQGSEKIKQIFAEVQHQMDVPLESGGNDGHLKCKFCTKTFLRARSLRLHILTHTEVKPYRCKTCGSSFSRYDHLNLHQVRCRGKRHLEVRIEKMTLEDLKRSSSKQFIQDDKLQCKECSKTFLNITALRRHISMMHVTDKPFSCKRCGKMYSSLKGLKAHNEKIKCRRAPQEPVNSAESVKSQPCHETSHLLQRIQDHYMNKMKFQCEACPRRFKQLGQLKVHERLHSGDKPYGCANCGVHFIRRDYLQRHLAKCHGRGQIRDKTVCDKCGNLFTQETLVVHQRTCVVESISSDSCKEVNKSNDEQRSTLRGFSCTSCGSHFLLFSQLQHHILANHRSDQSQLSDGKQQLLEVNMPQVKKEEAVDWQRPKPSNESLKCPKCEKKFSCPKQFGQHICKHNRSHPYSCLKCSVGFCSKKAMDKHRRKCKGLPVVSNHNSARHHSADEESSQADRVLVFNKGSNATGTGVLQTKFLCKDEEDNKSAEKKDAPHKYQCSECDQSFTNGLSLISHLEQHGREDQVLRTEGHKCNICNKVFTQVGVLQKHLKVQHKTKKSYSCTICSKCFRFPCDLESHKSRHDTNCPYVCDICEYRFPSQKSLTVHQGLSHGPTHLPNSHVKRSGVYRCEPCGRSYSLKGSYTKHCRLKHGNADQTNGEPKKPSVDLSPGTEKQGSDEDESAADFENDSDNDSDSAPYFPCHVCGKTFPTSESLEDHQRCHLGEKPFECEECGKCFLHLTSLQHHQRCHKSEFQCRLCGKGFVSLFSLRKHKQGHMRKGAFQCTKCSLSFTRASYLTEHMAFHKDENFPCDLCEETFSCKTSRAEHRKVHSEQEKLPPLIPPKQPETQKEPPANYSKSTSRNDREQHKLRCGICQGRFPDPEQLSEHGCNSAKERPYSCPECNKHFLHGSHLKKHQLSHQLSAGRGYQCNHCSMRFTHHHLFLNHLQSHNTEKASHSSKFPNTDETNKFAKIYQCPICPLSFYQALDLANHLSVHSHMCAVCNMTFPTQNDLDEHEQCHLTAATQYECTECGDDFIGSDAFRKHRCINPNTRVAPPVLFSKKRSSKSQFQADEEEDVDVGEDFIICPICKQRFSSNSSLMEHHKKHHEVSRPFKCLVCEKTFSQKRYLTQHQQTHNARPYKCTVCSESFKTETSLAYHSKLHDPKRQYHCPICNRNYLTEKDLSKHKLKHVQREDNREYRCDMCYKSFTMFAQLQKHQETHVGQVVYECTECDKAFAFLNLLEEHQRTHAASSAESLQSHSPSTSPY